MFTLQAILAVMGALKQFNNNNNNSLVFVQNIYTIVGIDVAGD